MASLFIDTGIFTLFITLLVGGCPLLADTYESFHFDEFFWEELKFKGRKNAAETS